MPRAVVVGSGPNGLTAAATLARAGLEVTVLEASSTIGGGTRSSELTVPGVLSDHCSAFHPTGAASPAFRDLALDRHGLEWLRPEVDLAHPIDSGPAATLHTSLAATAESLGADAGRWHRLFDRPVHHLDDLVEDLFGPPLHRPRDPLTYAQFGALALLPATVLARRFREPGTRALIAGLAAHSLRPLGVAGASAIGLMLAATGHVHGWPVARGGSRAITSALAHVLGELGGAIEVDQPITSWRDLPPADVVMLDTSPKAALAILGDRLPTRVARAYRTYRYGPGVYKMDFAVEGGVPWSSEESRRAGTVHLGGSFEEIEWAERAVDQGRMPDRPFVLVGQQYLADPGRSAGDVHPVWAYAHVPRSYAGDASRQLVAQIERFAPGFHDRVVATATRSPAELAESNANYVGGDIGVGTNSLRQMLFRPRATSDPYTTGVPGVYLCSAATPPGAGVHGMCGYHAASSALSHVPHAQG